MADSTGRQVAGETNETSTGNDGRLPHRRSLRAQARQIGAVVALTLLPALAALHFLYAALDMRYQRFWGLDQQAAVPGNPPDAPFLAEKQAAAKLAEVRRLAGQLIMIGFSGTSAEARRMRPLLTAIGKGHAGGIILFERNIKSAPQIKELIRSLQSAAQTGGKPPLLIAVDQEGGQVQRFKRSNGHRSAVAPSAKRVAQRCTPAEAEELYRAVACELRDAGVNVNLGPVVDVDSAGRSNPIIGARERSFAREADRVTGFGAAFIGAHRSAGVATSIKHFPGHGSSLTDSHKGFTDITKSFKTAELEPFRKLTSGGDDSAELVMVGHLHHAAFTGEGEPATFSRKLLVGELRGRMGFGGVVISDDLEMGAIRERYSLGEATIRAVNAGVDIVIVSNTGAYHPRRADLLYETLASAVAWECPQGEAGTCIPAQRIREAHQRVTALKSDIAARWRAGTPTACLPSPKKDIASICTGQDTGEEHAARWWNWFF